MKAEIISVGTELLIGSILNTNAQYLSRKLAEAGIDLYYQTTVGDNPGRLLDTLELTAKRSEIILTTGGLGPTEDDITLAVCAQFAKTRLIQHTPTLKSIQRRLQSHHYRLTKAVARQALVPEGSTVIANDQGTAPGIILPFQYQGCNRLLILLPGPQGELKPMVESSVLPYLSRRFKPQGSVFKTLGIKIAGLPESMVASRVNDLLKLKPPLTVGIYAKPGEVELKIMVKAATKKKALSRIRQIQKIIQRRFGHLIYGIDDEPLSAVTGHLLKIKKKTLAVAESCTGGLLSHLITETPGSSDYFKGSLVAYDNSVKIFLLGVDGRLFQKKGAVSREVALQMAKYARHHFATDLGIGITGIAGPSGGTSKKPVGLVYISLSSADKTVVKKHLFSGSRSDIKMRAAQTALNMLRLSLLS